MVIYVVVFLKVILLKIEGIKVTNNERRVGTVSRGIRCPIIREGDNLAALVSDAVLEAAEYEGFELNDRDVIAMTESIVARAQGNYASVEAIAADVREKLGGETKTKDLKKYIL